jgi:electron transfer flavoprotein alpha subunit
MSKIIVFVEHKNGTAARASLEAVSAARATGAEVIAIASADVAGAAGAVGAGQLIILSGAGASPDALAADLAAIAKESGASGFLAAATSAGRDLAPRVAALLDSTLFADCTQIRGTPAGLSAVRPWLAGKAIATLTSSGPVFCATTRPNAFALSSGGAAASISTRAATAGGKSQVTGIAPKPGGRLDVKEAPVVVSGGRGMKGPEHWNLIEELAASFGNAATGASRAVVDAGWRPHGEQVGQTGKTVAPQLYVAVGISGAIQHLAGMRTSKVIVAINKDKDAPIFKVADFGIVGDAFEVLPALSAAVKDLKAKG